MTKAIDQQLVPYAKGVAQAASASMCVMLGAAAIASYSYCAPLYLSGSFALASTGTGYMSYNMIFKKATEEPSEQIEAPSKSPPQTETPGDSLV